ncbi:sensory box histidine kinase/response regulator [Chitinispirillum alkaliphilum]|nr:sensory box histidine kinase/response regulator [Chitinispirillum alkaliphilum]
MQPISEAEVQIQKISGQMLEKVSLIVIIFGSLAVFTSSLRLFEEKSLNSLVDLITYGSSIAVLLLRKHMPVKAAAALLFSLVTLNAVFNFFTFGLATFGFAMLVSMTVIMGAFLGLRAGLIVFGFSITGISLAGILILSGIIVPEIDASSYYATPHAWAVQLTGFLLYGAMGLVVVTLIQKKLREALDQSLCHSREIALRNQQLQHSEKIRSVGLLAGGIAHDFNNQLSGIMGFAEIIRMESNIDTVHKHAESIITACRRASEMNGKLLAFSRKEKCQKTPVDLHGIIEETVELLSHSVDKKIRIETDLKASRCTIAGDPSQIQSALLNVAINARDAMPDGGTIKFSTTLCRTQKPDHNNSPSLITLSISDTGFGIGPDIMKHLFEPFFTTKEPGKGTGMGLAAVYGTVKAHGGFIDVFSKPDQGAVFTLTFPLSTGTEKVCSSKENDTSCTYIGKQILLVEDDDRVRSTTAKLLKKLGFIVTECPNGPEAINIFTSQGSGIDLIMLDIILPGISGNEVYSKIRKIKPDISVLFCSGYSTETENFSLESNPLTSFLRKPFTAAELSETLNRMFSQKIAVFRN